MLFTPLTLPNGTILPNRLAKAAMEENMADAQFRPTHKLMQLYKKWALGGAGLIISGNVMVNRMAMTGPAGVVLDSDLHLNTFRQWAKAGQQNGAQFWLQINHPGRQMPSALGQITYAPSAIALNLGKMSSRFMMPKELNHSMIQEIIEQFSHTAQLAEQAGFNGVQIHAAHGYLLSQFLSPLSNKRQDEYGGSLENRARLLIEVIQAIRKSVSTHFSISIKLNSADFQRGGFSTEDAKEVTLLLNHLSIDLLEISGGSYEEPAMQGSARDSHTLEREAYFLKFAQEIQKIANMPIMVTGGIRRQVIAQQVIDSGIDMAGIATALAIEPNLPSLWQQGIATNPTLKTRKWKNKAMGSAAMMASVRYQLQKVANNKATKPNISPLRALLLQQIKSFYHTKRYRTVVKPTVTHLDSSKA